MNVRRYLIFFGLLVIGLGCRNQFVDRLREQIPPGPTLGQPAPEFEATALDGESFSWETLRGRAVILNTWATWCVPCREEMPELQALHEQYSTDDLFILGVSIDAVPTAEVEDFLRDRGITYTNVMARTDDVAARYNMSTGVPKTILIDHEGVVQGYWQGRFWPFEEETEAAIRSLVEAAKRARSIR